MIFEVPLPTLSQVVSFAIGCVVGSAFAVVGLRALWLSFWK